MADENIYRYERKFLVSDLDRYTVEKIIKLNVMNFNTLYPSRKINNIYFDSTEMKCFYDNIDGIANREKFRIRWYGDTFGYIDKPILEIKIRKNSVGTKEFYQLNSFDFNKDFNEVNLKNIIISSDIPSIVKEKVLAYSPKLINGYIRKYFISFDKKFRITLDSDLFYIKAKSNNIITEEKFVDKKSVVVEVKYDVGDDKELDLITRQFNFRLSKNSKYVTGIYKLYY